MNNQILTFRDLRVYRKACELDLAVFLESKRFPREEMYSLTDQVRRSSRSIGANLAEAWAKRRYPAHFLSKLTDADAELQETEHWLDRSAAYRYLQAAEFDSLIGLCKSTGNMLGKMIRNPEPFCRKYQ